MSFVTQTAPDASTFAASPPVINAEAVPVSRRDADAPLALGCVSPDGVSVLARLAEQLACGAVIPARWHGPTQPELKRARLARHSVMRPRSLIARRSGVAGTALVSSAGMFRRKLHRANPFQRGGSNAANAQPTIEQFANACVRETFAQRLPVWVLSGNDHRLDKMRRRRAEAISKRYIALNDATEVRWLLIDMDKPDAYVGEWNVRTHWRDCGVSEPNIIVVNPATGNGQYFYALGRPLTTASNNGRKEPLAWFYAIRRGMTRRLKADPGYGGGTARNPLFDGHEAVWSSAKPYSLKQLDAGLTKAEKARAAWHQANGIGTGRNATIFAALCGHGFGHFTKFKARGGTTAEWRAILAKLAAELNGEFPQPLDEGEVTDMVGRVSDWLWNEYQPRRTQANQIKAGRASAAKRKAAVAAALSVSVAGSRREQIEKVASALGVSLAWARRLSAKSIAESRVASIRDDEPWKLYGIARATYFRDLKSDRLKYRKPISVEAPTC